MRKIFKTIKSLFSKDKHSVYTDEIYKNVLIYYTIVKQVRLANIKYKNYMFSIIPSRDNIIIKCQTTDNVYNMIHLNLVICMIFQRDELIEYINKELKVLVCQTASSYNCYKAEKAHSKYKTSKQAA